MRFLIASGIAAATFFSAHAETTTNPPIKFIGLKAGFNLSSTWGRDAHDKGGGLLPGVCLGAFVPIPMSKLFTLEPGVQFSVRGTTWDSDSSDTLYKTYTDVGYTYRRRLGYLEVPVMVKLVFPVGGGPVKPFLYAGPVLGLRVFDRTTNSANDQGVDHPNPPQDSSKVFDPSVAAGAGVHVVAWQGYFVLAARMTLDVLSFEKGSRDVKTWCGTASLEYVWNLVRKKSRW